MNKEGRKKIGKEKDDSHERGGKSSQGGGKRRRSRWRGMEEA